MNVFIIGATGLIGSTVAKKLIDKGFNVVGMGLAPINYDLVPKGLKVIEGDYIKMSDKELKKQLKGSDALIFAAGIDERIDAKPPIYDLFKKYNNDSLERVLSLAKEVGVKKVSVCGSYFTYFNRLYPKLELTKHHPYIKSRVEQLEIALSYSDNDFDVAVIELPYIFGTQRGRKPVWVFLIEIIKKMKLATFYSKGGTTMITVNQAADAVVGGILYNKGAKAYPIGYYNLSWKELFKVIHEGMGYKRRAFITVPNFIFKMGLRIMDRKKRNKGLEGGLKLKEYIKIQTKYLYIDKDLGSTLLKVEEDCIKCAIIDSVKSSLRYIDDNKTYIDMKVEWANWKSF